MCRWVVIEFFPCVWVCGASACVSGVSKRVLFVILENVIVTSERYCLIMWVCHEGT